MPDKDIVDYIKENKNKYGIKALKKGLIEQGVDAEDIEEAIRFVEDEDEKKIAEFLKEDESEAVEEIEEDVLISPEVSRSEYIEKADKVIGAVTDVFGIAKRDKKNIY